MLAAVVAARTRKRVLATADDLEALQRRRVRTVLVGRAAGHAQLLAEQADARGDLGRVHLDRQRVVPSDNRGRAGRAAEARGPVARRVSAGRQVRRADVVVVRAHRRLDPTVARRADRRAAVLPRVVVRVAVVLVVDAADREDVLLHLGFG